jgi:hypothetical protein
LFLCRETCNILISLLLSAVIGYEVTSKSRTMHRRRRQCQAFAWAIDTPKKLWAGCSSSATQRAMCKLAFLLTYPI